MSIRLRTFSCILLSSFLWAQDIAWQQTLGGAREEHLYDAISGNIPNVLVDIFNVSKLLIICCFC